jgi:hypothetical protein
MTDTTRALLIILNPGATVPQLEGAADELRAAHPERPRAYLVTLLAAEALEARTALKPLQRRVKALEDTLEEVRATRHSESCDSCFWQDGDMCLKFSEPHERFGYCRAGYKPGRSQPGSGRRLPLQVVESWTS